jgi:hypothetical protein
MRPFHLLPVLGLLFGARAFGLDSRALFSHPLDVRDTTDTCAFLDTALTVTKLGVQITVGTLGASVLISNIMLGVSVLNDYQTSAFVYRKSLISS